MRKALLSLIVIIVLTACNSSPATYSINGTLVGEVKDGTKVFLRKVGEDRQPVDLDTTTILDGKFVFSGSADSIPAMRYIFIDSLLGYTGLVVERGEIQLTAQKDSLGLAKVKGTMQNDIFADYLKNLVGIQKRAQSIQKDMRDASANKDSIAMGSLRDELNELQEESNSFNLKYIKDNPNSLIAAVILDNVFMAKVIPADEVQGLYEALAPNIKATEAGKSVLGKLDALKENEEKIKNTTVGAKAPNFSAPTPTGEQLALNDVLGKVTLVDFWAAWCRPCRAENPNVVNVYRKYHDKGLNIVGVSLDRKAEDWKKAIADDGLTWNHVSHVQYFNDPIAKLYNVDAIPAAFLLDENGIIVAKNLRGPALEQKVAELLN